MGRKALDINWNKFNGDTFQDMCNDLLVAENIHVEPFKSGPYVDKGQDARLYKGTIGDISGMIIFNSKYHKPRPGTANITALKNDIKGTSTKKGELGKAEESNADHLVILTNVALTKDQHDKLLALAGGRSVRLHIWYEEKIEALLVKNPSLH